MSKIDLQIVMGLLGIIPVVTGLLGLLGIEDPFYAAAGVPPIVLLDTNLRFYSGVRTVDGPWADQVKVHTISKIKKRISSVPK